MWLVSLAHGDNVRSCPAVTMCPGLEKVKGHKLGLPGSSRIEFTWLLTHLPRMKTCMWQIDICSRQSIELLLYSLDLQEEIVQLLVRKLGQKLLLRLGAARPCGVGERHGEDGARLLELGQPILPHV